MRTLDCSSFDVNHRHASLNGSFRDFVAAGRLRAMPASRENRHSTRKPCPTAMVRKAQVSIAESNRWSSIAAGMRTSSSAPAPLKGKFKGNADSHRRGRTRRCIGPTVIRCQLLTRQTQPEAAGQSSCRRGVSSLYALPSALRPHTISGRARTDRWLKPDGSAVSLTSS